MVMPGGGEAHPASGAATILADAICCRIPELGWGGRGKGKGVWGLDTHNLLQRFLSDILLPSGQNLGTYMLASFPVASIPEVNDCLL